MKRALCAMIVAMLSASCGAGSGESIPLPSAPSPAVQGRESPAAESRSAKNLAVALSGQVERISETEYRMSGPEVKCAAMLLDGDSTVAVTSEVKWTVEPEGSGVFSEGAAGVYFLPNEKGVFRIRARYPYEGDPQAQSPLLTLTWS